MKTTASGQHLLPLVVFVFYRPAFANSDDVCDMKSCTALEQARELANSQPTRRLKKGGEFEGGDFWEKHESLLTRAWSQVTRLHPELYVYNDIFQEKFINSDLRHAVQKLKEAANFSGKFVNELYIKTLISEAEGVKDVFYVGKSEAPRFGLFTKEFSDLFLKELDYLSNSGIPMRRPNGMNRYGAILDQIGFKQVFDGIVRDYIRPLAEMLYPEHISGEDAEENYAFIVDYQKDPDDDLDEKDFDIDLKEHRDSSVATLNVCLGYDNFTGGNVSFRADEPGGFGQNSRGTGEIAMAPGLAMLHKGQHRHAALPIKSGRRVNLIIWLMGKGGYVRVMPYKSAEEQLTGRDRWGRD